MIPRTIVGILLSVGLTLFRSVPYAGQERPAAALPSQVKMLSLGEVQANPPVEFTSVRKIDPEAQFASPEVTASYQKVLNFILETYASKANPDWFSHRIEFGWLVLCRGRRTEPWQLTPDVADIAIYLPNVEAPLLDILPKGKSGWTHMLQQAVVVRNGDQAKEHAYQFLKALNISMDELEVRATEATKVSYIPRVYTPAGHLGQGALEYSSRLADPITMYFEARATNPIIRRCSK